MKMKHFKLFSVVLLAGLVIASCKKKDDDDDNEEENITTIKVTLTPVTGGSAVTYTWKDVDGAGGNAPVLTPATIILLPSIPYNCALQFLDESKTPAVDITPEIVAEANDHQVYYAATGVLVNVGNLNNDGNGLPLGITSIWSNTGVSNGSMKITLKHKPGQKAAGDAVTKGETDVEIDYPTRVQ